MLWHNFLTTAGVARKLARSGNLLTKYANKTELEILELLLQEESNPRGFSVGDPGAMVLSEFLWCSEKKPFFNVWPVIAPSLIRIKLDIPSASVLKAVSNLPVAILVRFPVGREQGKIQSFLASRALIGNRSEAQRSISIRCDGGQRGPGGDDDLVTWDTCFSIDKETTVESELLANAQRSKLRPPGSKHYLSTEEGDTLVNCVRLFIAIALMKDDPSLVEPLVLSKDRMKYESTKDMRLVEKAHKRGIVGWNVGMNVEVSPHYRRAHFALRWTGKGRRIPRIVPIKGTIVKRVRMTDVPTGYLEKSGYN